MRSDLRAFLYLGVGIMVGLGLSMSWQAYGAPALLQGDCRAFPETGHKVCGRFLAYWDSHGGLPQQGYPLSEEFVETSDLDGKPYTVQYFERAVFEHHPENQPPHDVLLSQLGTYLGHQKYTQGFPANTGEAPFYEDRTAALALLKSYYNAINRREYERAYGYFEGAPNPLPELAPPYDQFVAGYADTASVALALGAERTGAAAGSIYTSVRVVLTARQTSGASQQFGGCYTLRRANEGISPNPADELWRIYSATLEPLPPGAAVDALLAETCMP